MAQMNRRQSREAVRTHEGGRAQLGSVEDQLRRAVTACMLWEDSFYESGENIADRIRNLGLQADPVFVIELAKEVRLKHRIRHAPLWLALSILPRKDVTGKAKSEFITSLITRADEIAELLSMYWDGAGEGKPVAAALKRGLAGAFHKFDEYQFGKYKGHGKAVTLRDAMFIAHPKPRDEEQAALFKRIANDELATPDTWETNLSAGKDKAETFTRLLEGGKLGYMACLRNIRNMLDAGVNSNLISKRLEDPKGRGGVLPFQFISAALMVPQFESVLDSAMLDVLESMNRFPGKTAILVDTSGSMQNPVSERSILRCVDAAAGMAIMARELCDDVRVYAWSSKCMEVPARRGMALRDAITSANVGHATFGNEAVAHAMKDGPWDRMIVISDMQLHDNLRDRATIQHKYMVNVRGYEKGVGYGNWKWIDGFSAQTIRYMQELEAVE